MSYRAEVMFFQRYYINERYYINGRLYKCLSILFIKTSTDLGCTDSLCSNRLLQDATQGPQLHSLGDCLHLVHIGRNLLVWPWYQPKITQSIVRQVPFLSQWWQWKISANVNNQSNPQYNISTWQMISPSFIYHVKHTKN